MNNRPRATVQRTKAQEFGAAFVAARRGYVGLLMFLASVFVTGCQSPATSSAPQFGQSTIPPPGTATTAMANPGAFAATAPPMGNPGQVNGWGPPPASGAPPSNWNSPSIFGGSAPPTGGTAWNPNQPPSPYGSQGSIFDQAPPTQQKGVFDSFAGGMNPYPSGSFNPGGATHGYESPSSTFTAAIPAHSTKRGSPGEASSGSWWDRLTGTKSTVPAAGSPGWNQPAPMGAPTNGVAWNDPRNPSFQRQPIPNPNNVASGWNITPPPNTGFSNPLNTTPNYTNYGSPPPASMPNSISRTLPATTNPMQPSNTLPASWPNGGSAVPTPVSPPPSGTPWVKSIEDLPPAR